MATTKDTATDVRRILIETLRLDVARDELADDTRLLDGGLGLDSLAGLKLIMSVEQQFGVRFDADDISRESLRSVGSFVSLVERKVGSGGGPAGA